MIGLCFVKAEWRAADRGRFDPGGALLYAGSISILCLGVSRLPGAAGLVLLANLRVESGLAYLIFALALTGLGFSLFSAPNINAIIGSAGREAYGSANGVVATMRILGQMSSMALVMLVFALTLGAAQITAEHYAALESAIRLSFTVAAILCLPGLYFSLIRGKMRADS